MDILRHNRSAWDQKVAANNRWTRPVTPDVIQRARSGEFEVLLTPSKPVPRSWFPELRGLRVLCLASGGGQQGPILAAAGAVVTVLDNSPRQLQQDQLVADREDLSIELFEGDMRDLSRFSSGAFQFIFHPCSNCFVPNVVDVWQHCYRVLEPGGVLVAGFNNPARYIFDDERAENGSLEVRHRVPYSDLKDLSPAELQRFIDANEPLEFGHTLDDQIGGQLDCGFVLTGFYEDRYHDAQRDPLSKYLSTFIATRSRKNESRTT